MKMRAWSIGCSVLLACAACTGLLGDYHVESGQGGETSNSHTSSVVGASTSSDGGFGAIGGGSGSGAGNPTCDDPGPEPNDTDGTPTLIEDSLLCSPVESSTQSGVLAGAVDVDFYTFPNASDVCAGPTKPTLNVDVASTDMRFCIFPLCERGVTPDILECEPLSDSAVSDSGTPGCCALGGASVVLHLECVVNLGTTVTLIVRVDQTTDACSSYQFTLTHST
jgi:hypothetical protein